MAQGVFEAASSGDRVRSLEALAETLVDAIKVVDVSQVPGLAARLVDVLKRIGGGDPTVLLWLRDGLASAIDRLAEVQGQRDEKGKPLGTELAPMVRQLVGTIEVLDAVHLPTEVSPLDEIAAARARRTASRRSGPADMSRSS